MKVFINVFEDVVYNVLRVSSIISIEFEYLVPLCIGGAVYFMFQANKEVKFISILIIFSAFLASPLMKLASAHYYHYWALNREKIVTNTELVIFVFLVLLTMLSMWVLHRVFDTLYERVTTSLRKKSSQKQKVKTDIENMQKGEDYMPFDPLVIEKRGFVALGKNYE